MTEKLIRRHPHVFEERRRASCSSARRRRATAEVLANWDRIKREVEGRAAEDPFADIPENLPGLLYARKVLRRADPAGGAPPGRESRDEAEAAVGEILLEAVAIVAAPRGRS